jgi:hypothetical protein
MMKKLVLIVIMLGILFSASSCDAFLNFDEDILAMEADILAQIPDEINDDFDIAIDDKYEITFTIGDVSSEGQFIYESPFYDQEETLYVSIKRGRSEITFEKDVMFIAEDSGLNETKIYLNLNVGANEINKDTYLQTNVRVETKKNGEDIVDHQTSEAQVRGRGNSTWWSYPKKPYRLHFDKNTSILGMKEAKNYVLLAEYADKSLIRNAITHKMATLFSHIDYHLDIRFVELFINDEYQGVYLLTEQIENHPNKLGLLSEAGVVDTNYLFELDMRFYEQEIPEGFDWFLVDRHPYQIKDPDPDDLLYTNAHAEHLQSYMYALETALIEKEGYDLFLDVDNAIDFFLIHEIAKNVDVGWSSVFMIKHASGPISYGPLWDFDFAYGNADYIDYGPDNWYGMREWKNRMFILMMQIPSIRTAFKERFEMYYEDILPEMSAMIPVLGQSLEAMAARNFEKWPILSTYVWPNPWEMLIRDTYDGQVDYVHTYLIMRSNWIDQALEGSSYLSGHFDN